MNYRMKQLMKQVAKNKAREDIPTIGDSESWGVATEEQQNIAEDNQREKAREQYRQERTENEEQDTPSEKRQMVMNGAKLKCPYAQAEGTLKVTSNEINLQDQIWATEGDCNNMANLLFPGLCTHPKWGDKKPPCNSVIFLDSWKNVGTSIVQEQNVLVKESCINCNPTPNATAAKPIPKAKEQEEKKEIQINTDYFIDGYWADADGNKITQSKVGDTVYFHVITENIPAGEEIGFTLYDWDGWANPDDDIPLVYIGGENKGKPYNKVSVDKDGKATIILTLSDKFLDNIEDDSGEEIELYYSVSYKGKTADLPADTDNYLIVYEEEIKITVIVELPHSKDDSFWGGKGLAGHSAMAIGEKYFDYGPDYDLNDNGIPDQVLVSEEEYDYDFNDDGDKDDIVEIDERDLSFEFAPGRPWWGEMVARELGISVDDVTLNDVLDYIKLDWRDTRIFGQVYSIEFYVKKSQADKMEDWWTERYKHLKIYSVWPWKGEQCTTAVKLAINEGLGYSAVSKETQKPSGLLHELKYFISSTSWQHNNERTQTKVIKEEDPDWKP